MPLRRAAPLLAVFAALAPSGAGAVEAVKSSDPSEFDGTNYASLVDWKDVLDPTHSIVTLSSFGEDALGNLYLVDLGNPFVPLSSDGSIYRIVPEPSAGLLLALGLGALARKVRKEADVRRPTRSEPKASVVQS